MSIDKLKRVMWRLDALGTHNVRRIELVRAIMIECGTSHATIWDNQEALLRLGWLKREKKRFQITDKHKTQDFAQ